MKKRWILPIFLVMLMTLPVTVLGVPHREPTPQEIEEAKNVEQYGWHGRSIPDRHTVEPDWSHDDIAPKLTYRYQNGWKNEFKVRYNIQSSGSFRKSWTDEFWLDDDVNVYAIQFLSHVNEQINRGDNDRFYTNVFSAPRRALFDMNIQLDVYNQIGENEGDYNPNNNHDEEYMYFWYL